MAPGGLCVNLRVANEMLCWLALVGSHSCLLPLVCARLHSFAGLRLSPPICPPICPRSVVLAGPRAHRCLFVPFAARSCLSPFVCWSPFGGFVPPFVRLCRRSLLPLPPHPCPCPCCGGPTVRLGSPFVHRPSFALTPPFVWTAPVRAHWPSFTLVPPFVLVLVGACLASFMLSSCLFGLLCLHQIHS
jgi:hypothetical protein